MRDEAGRLARMETANHVIRIMASHGRRFFSQDADRPERMESPRISRFEFATGRLWFIDKYTDMRIFVHWEPTCRGRWRGFSDGGTLRGIVEHLRDHILHVKPINLAYFGASPKWVCGSDLWGYGDAMADVTREVRALLESTERSR